MDAAAIYASHPLETHGVEELALEATQEHLIKMVKWCQAAAQAVQDNFFIPVIVRICKKEIEKEPLTNFFAWLQHRVPVLQHKCGPKQMTCLQSSRS